MIQPVMLLTLHCRRVLSSVKLQMTLVDSDPDQLQKVRHTHLLCANISFFVLLSRKKCIFDSESELTSRRRRRPREMLFHLRRGGTTKEVDARSKSSVNRELRATESKKNIEDDSRARTKNYFEAQRITRVTQSSSIPSLPGTVNEELCRACGVPAR